MKKTLLVIGGGIAGLNAAKAARDADGDWDISILELENLNTYTRTRIPHYISGEAELKEIMPYDDEWYKKNNINLIKDIKVNKIDTKEKKVLTDKGIYSYDSLVIALGSSPSVPSLNGVEKGNIITIRTIQDAEIAINLAKKSKNCTIIGGGLLGLEMAWSIMQLGCKVNVIVRGGRLLPKQTDDIASSLLFTALQSKGMNIYLNGVPDCFLGEDSVTGLRLKDGTIVDSDFVIISAGVKANVSALEGIGLDIGKAVKVDDYMRTNLENIYAAGDVAEYGGKSYCIWPIASSQGKVAGSNAVGKKIQYEDMKPYTQLKIPGISLFTIGDIFCEECKELQELNNEENKYMKFLLKDGKIKGAIIFGDASLVMNVKKAVEGNKQLGDVRSMAELISLLR